MVRGSARTALYELVETCDGRFEIALVDVTEPTQINAPSVSYSTKTDRGVPTTPASALAIDAKPGTNLAISSDLGPQRP